MGSWAWRHLKEPPWGALSPAPSPQPRGFLGFPRHSGLSPENTANPRLVPETGTRRVPKSSPLSCLDETNSEGGAESGSELKRSGSPQREAAGRRFPASLRYLQNETQLLLGRPLELNLKMSPWWRRPVARGHTRTVTHTWARRLPRGHSELRAGRGDLSDKPTSHRPAGPPCGGGRRPACVRAPRPVSRAQPLRIRPFSLPVGPQRTQFFCSSYCHLWETFW